MDELKNTNPQPPLEEKAADENSGNEATARSIEQNNIDYNIPYGYRQGQYNPKQVHYYGSPYGYNQNPYQPLPPTPEQIAFYEMQEQYRAEKKAVKRTANSVGLGLIVFFAVAFIISEIVGIIFGIFKIDAEILNQGVFFQVFNLVLTFVGFTVASLIIAVTQKTKISKLASFGRPKKGKFLPAVMLGIGLCYVGNIINAIIASYLPDFLYENYSLPQSEKGVFAIILSVIATAVFPALLEELTFRGVIMGSLLKFGKPFAIFTSSLLFALVHGNMTQIPFAFVAGLACGYAVTETGSIWTGIVIHFLNNFLAVVLDYVGVYFGDNIQNAAYLILLSTVLLVGFFGVYFLSHKNKGFLKFNKTPHLSTAGMRFKWFASTATIVIYFIYVGLQVLGAPLL